LSLPPPGREGGDDDEEDDEGDDKEPAESTSMTQLSATSTITAVC
jgi:hypothetical protein